MNEPIESEVIANDGDVFAIDECTECGGFVIERYMTKNPGVRAAPSENPDDVIDMPSELAEWFRRAVNLWADRVKGIVADVPEGSES